MKYFIYHPQPGSKEPKQVECSTFREAEAEYKRLQDIYPSREMRLVCENEYGDRAHLHGGRWE